MKLFLGFIAIYAALLMCSCDDDDCEKCDAAITHMFAKIDQNGCDPARMEGATQRIREDCGRDLLTHDEGYIYLMAETCCAGSTVLPICKVAPRTRVPIILRAMGPFTTGMMIDVRLGAKDHRLMDGEMLEVELEITQNFWEDIVVHEPDDFGAKLAEDRVFATFIRVENYCQKREVVVTEPTPNNFQVTFINWE